MAKDKTPKPDTVTWSEVCKKVRIGDGLYSTCRSKVSDFPAGGYGFHGGALDEVPEPGGGVGEEDFDKRVSKSALSKIPEPPSKELLERFPPGYGQEAELFGFPVKQLLMYGGIAALVYFLLMRNKAQIVGTETAAPEAASKDVTAPKAA